MLKTPTYAHTHTQVRSSVLRCDEALYGPSSDRRHNTYRISQCDHRGDPDVWAVPERGRKHFSQQRSILWLAEKTIIDCIIEERVKLRVTLIRTYVEQTYFESSFCVLLRNTLKSTLKYT